MPSVPTDITTDSNYVLITDDIYVSKSTSGFTYAGSTREYRSIREALEARTKNAEAKDRTKNRRVEVKGLNASGDPITITGYNKGNGAVMFTDAKGGKDQTSGLEIYVPLPRIANILRAAAKHRTIAHLLNSLVYKFHRLSVHKQGYGRMGETKYEAALNALERDWLQVSQKPEPNIPTDLLEYVSEEGDQSRQTPA